MASGSNHSQFLFPISKALGTIGKLFRKRRQEPFEEGQLLVDNIPDDIWIIIFQFSMEWPRRFILRDVCHRFRFIIDHCFKSVGVIDLIRYSALNSKVNLDKQMNYIVNHFGKKIKGIKSEDHGKFNSIILVSALTTVINQNRYNLEIFNLAHLLEPGSHLGNLVSDLTHTATNLVELKLLSHKGKKMYIVNQFEIDFVNLKHLRILHLSGILPFNCIVPLVSELCLDHIRLESIQHEASINQLLQSCCSTVQHLSLLNLRAISQYTSDTNNILQCPMLKTLDYTDYQYDDCTSNLRAVTFSLDISQANELTKLNLPDSYSNGSDLKLIGMNLSTHSITHMYVESRHALSHVDMCCFTTCCSDVWERLVYINMEVSKEIFDKIMEGVLMCGHNLRYIALSINDYQSSHDVSASTLLHSCPKLEHVRLPLFIQRDDLVNAIVEVKSQDRTMQMIFRDVVLADYDSEWYGDWDGNCYRDNLEASLYTSLSAVRTKLQKTAFPIEIVICHLSNRSRYSPDQQRRRDWQLEKKFGVKLYHNCHKLSPLQLAPMQW